MRFKLGLCLLICTFGTAAYCDEQAAARAFAPKEIQNSDEIPDPGLGFSADELADEEVSKHFSEALPFDQGPLLRRSQKNGKLGTKKSQ